MNALPALIAEVRALRESNDKMRAAIEGFFTPGPGIAMPARHEPDLGEPHMITWNRKIDALLAAIGRKEP